jgi:hypothetical protein
MTDRAVHVEPPRCRTGSGLADEPTDDDLRLRKRVDDRVLAKQNSGCATAISLVKRCHPGGLQAGAMRHAAGSAVA